MSDTTKTENPISQASRSIEFVEPENGILRTYANHHRYGWTGYDIRILFGEVVDVTDDKIIIEETAHITMSWQQAKELVGTLQAAIAEHEAPTSTSE